MSKLSQIFIAPIGLIALIHLVGGVAIMAEPKAAWISGLAGPYALFHSPELLGILLVSVGGFALYGRLSDDPIQRFIFVLPQQIVLVLQLMGIIVPIWHGAYPDGYIPVPGDRSGSIWFILGDQVPLIGLCLSHLVEMVAGGDTWHLKELRWERERNRYLERHIAIMEEGPKFQALINSMDFRQPLVKSLDQMEFDE